MTDADSLQTIATFVPDIALAATLTMFVVAAIRSWIPTQVAGRALNIDGGRVLPLVFTSSVVVTALLADELIFNRALIATSLAVSVFAVSEYTALQFLNGNKNIENEG